MKSQRRRTIASHSETMAMVEASTLPDIDKAHLASLLRVMQLSAGVMEPGEWRQAREYAGLSLGQAAKLLGTPRADLERIEAGTLRPSAAVMEQMDVIYGLGS